jgi:hypothetical protein
VKIPSSWVAVSLALASVAISGTQGRAQTGPQTHRFCALDINGGTDCYFDSRSECGSRCIENPSYSAEEGRSARPRTGSPRRPRR